VTADASSDRRLVLVSPRTAVAERPRLFAALEAAFQVRFAPWSSEHVDAAGVITIGSEGARTLNEDPSRRRLPTLAIAGGSAASGAASRFTVRAVPGVDRRLHGIELADRLMTAPTNEDQTPEDVLAVSGSQPVWLASRAAVPAHRVHSTLPELAPGEVLYRLLGERQLTTIALVQFLRSVTSPREWRSPPLRAAFLFDDPNLRWRSYGFIDYARLVEHADEHGYHAAMAMIPLDAGRPHPPTVSLFRRRTDRLSLVVHGNDHTKHELLAAQDDAAALTLGAQALRRIARFERRCGLRVDRVMTPPHGLCSPQMARALGSLGFDALSAIHPLPWTEKPTTGPLLAGWRPADFVAGCPIVPRIPLGSTSADIALRAFLDHPLIVYGHHEDVADGLDALAHTAATINRLGDVSWMSIGEIAATNSQLSVRGGRAIVRPFARRIRLGIDPTWSSMTIQAPEDSVDGGALTGFSLTPVGLERRARSRLMFGEAVSLESMPAVEAEIVLHGASDLEPDQVPAPAWRPWPKLRRVATELRDRTGGALDAPANRRPAVARRLSSGSPNRTVA
jgi:hypothetical protein